MNFTEIALSRQSCRAYDPTREIEMEKINAVLESAILAPSACNGQPYHITVCCGDKAKAVADCVTGLGMNKFAKDAPVLLVISEEDYVASAAFGAKVKKNDYRSIDIVSSSSSIVISVLRANSSKSVPLYLAANASLSFTAFSQKESSSLNSSAHFLNCFHASLHIWK